MSPRNWIIRSFGTECISKRVNMVDWRIMDGLIPRIMHGQRMNLNKRGSRWRIYLNGISRKRDEMDEKVMAYQKQKQVQKHEDKFEY